MYIELDKRSMYVLPFLQDDFIENTSILVEFRILPVQIRIPIYTGRIPNSTGRD